MSAESKDVLDYVEKEGAYIYSVDESWPLTSKVGVTCDVGGRSEMARRIRVEDRPRTLTKDLRSYQSLLLHLNSDLHWSPARVADFGTASDLIECVSTSGRDDFVRTSSSITHNYLMIKRRLDSAFFQHIQRQDAHTNK